MWLQVVVDFLEEKRLIQLGHVRRVANVDRLEAVRQQASKISVEHAKLAVRLEEGLLEIVDLLDLARDPTSEPGRIATRLSEMESHLNSLVTSVRRFNTQLQRLMRDDALLKATHELAAEIAGNSPLVVQGTKAVLRAGEGHSVAEGLDYVGIWNAAFLQSNDLVEAMTAFAEKRAPHFTGD